MACFDSGYLVRPSTNICSLKFGTKQECVITSQGNVISASKRDKVGVSLTSLRKRWKLLALGSKRDLKFRQYAQKERKAVPTTTRCQNDIEQNGSLRGPSSRWTHDGSTLLTEKRDGDDENDGGHVSKEDAVFIPFPDTNPQEEPEGLAPVQGTRASREDSTSVPVLALASAGKVFGKWRQNIETAWGGAAPDSSPHAAPRDRVQPAREATSDVSREASTRAEEGSAAMAASFDSNEGLNLRVDEGNFYERQGGAQTPSGKPGIGDKREGSSSGEEEDLDQWDIFRRFWNHSAFVRFRVSLSLANLTMAIPTFLARALPLLAHVTGILPFREASLPVLAPLLFGGGIVFKSVSNNLGYVLPRLGMSVAMLWMLWGLNSFLQEAIGQLGKFGVIDPRLSNGLVLVIELTVTAVAVVTSLSSVGVRISSLVMPFFIAVALAGKDVWHNYFAGFFLFAAQPFRPGDTIALTCSSEVTPPAVVPLQTQPQPQPQQQLGSGWFEGMCESVDLRYTVLRNGRYRLMVPNSRFVQREFLVMDSGGLVKPPEGNRSTRRKKGGGGARGCWWGGGVGASCHAVWLEI